MDTVLLKSQLRAKKVRDTRELGSGLTGHGFKEGRHDVAVGQAHPLRRVQAQALQQPLHPGKRQLGRKGRWSGCRQCELRPLTHGLAATELSEHGSQLLGSDKTSAS